MLKNDVGVLCSYSKIKLNYFVNFTKNITTILFSAFNNYSYTGMNVKYDYG